MEQRGPYCYALRANHGDDLRSLLDTERDRTMRFRDQLAEERSKSNAMKIALDNLIKSHEEVWAENEKLKRNIAELKTKVDNQQEELLDCRAIASFTQGSRDYWRGACSKLTSAIGIDAINDAVEWINNAKRDLLSLAEIGRTKDWQISDLLKQLVLAKDRGNKQFDRANGLISATGTYNYDHTLDWIERHRSNDEVDSLLGDKV